MDTAMAVKLGTAEAVQQREEERCRQLYAQHGDRIYRLCLRLCGRPADAEDLVQEVFLAAFQGWGRFSGRSSVVTWLTKIALSDLSKSLAPGDASRAETVTLNGHPALMFREHVHGMTDGAGPGRQTINGADMFWADPHTLRVIRHRSDIVWGQHRIMFGDGHSVTLPEEQIVTDASRFQYDAPAPAGVFNLTLPTHARVTEDDGHGNKTVVADKS